MFTFFTQERHLAEENNNEQAQNNFIPIHKLSAFV